ncbi:MAG: DUF1565 domain-containing protein [Trichodesmium sp. St16_bin4-tuft]|nr:DUF1565 domain-containing protein [Trichodesmium sp. St5_bin8]MDE5078758.1 DUF1565 domain-containing protein [Trichodesmium sp. St2_bin6]MDE5090520.1 DUF1565 domain-containing protein [Trichodesmium sp. St18_bin3_1_1]MDE5100983.1 DUF1565 domain-containing protein [Trichodesmium sp. St16_bin4-tuft]MDE5103417.1 DUF1565 domain-containing protein [Trichodesmium sp. St19_bin2]
MNPIFIISLSENNHTNLLHKTSYLSILLATVLLGLFASTSLAVPSIKEVAQVPENQANSQMKVLYVSSSIGRDYRDGTKTTPLKTITYALKIAQPNTTILLAPGTYSRQTGEVFPLILKPKVTIKGNFFNRGKNVLIIGGGNFNSSTVKQKNITIIAAKNSKLNGVTVTNPNLQGYGLWIESSDFIISKNTFTGNRMNGISIVGNNIGMIQENTFYNNGRNGIKISDNSQPEIRNNLFQNTAVGIKISDNAAPQVIGNRLIENQNGIIIQGNAQPILRGNYIENNRQNGVAATARSLPDLGNSQDPGRNTIRNNGQYNIYSVVKGKIIPAYGNSLEGDRNYGSIDIAGKIAPPPRVAPVRNTPTTPNVDQVQRESKKEAVVMETAPLRQDTQVKTKESNFSPSAEKPPEQSISSNIVSRARTQNSTREIVIIPVPLPETQKTSRTNSYEQPNGQRNLQRVLETPNYDNRQTIKIPVLPPESGRRALEALSNLPPRSTPPTYGSKTPVAAPSVLPVPTANIPLGRGGYVPPGIAQNKNPLPLSRLSLRSNSQNHAAALGLRYRVVVSVNNISQQYKLRTLVPDAFSTKINGNSIMQAGAFRSRFQAKKLLRTLQNNGLNAKILPVQ